MDVYQLDERPAVEFTEREARGVRLAQGLGLFSIGLGLTELVVPRALGAVIGTPGSGTKIMRAFGARELTSGVSLLVSRDPVRALDARIAGDFLDLVALGIAFVRPQSGRKRLMLAAGAVLGATVLDIIARKRLAADPNRAIRVGQRTRIGKAVTIDAEPDQIYTFWRGLEDLPSIFPNLGSVEMIDDERSRWTASGPGGTKLTWESQLIDDEPGRLLAWTTDGGPFQSDGVVHFLPAPGGRGTEVAVEMEYHVVGGGLGRAAALGMGMEPGVELEKGLRRLKQLFELGEIMDARSSTKKGSV
ncbi:MAG TPA: SRPBCC family protein [Kofleriaceae bacterium]|nr:SRPBCC family protein [Kofleriaceae bacterium]